tara:strand:- start:140 stop:730 length:591 start_codon:yes stop_codon:yes gene_type:complete
MFSGIIQGTGKIATIKNDKTYIETDLDLSECDIGSSINCNGVCLTAVSIEKIDKNIFLFSVNISEETKKRSTFNAKNICKIINLEKSLKVGNEISGHFVYGHVDCISEILLIEKLESSWNYHFKINDKMKKFIVEKGSISINGISLTIANVSLKSFSISIIPHTFENTNLKALKIKDLVNVEFDSLARYILNNDTK